MIYFRFWKLEEVVLILGEIGCVSDIPVVIFLHNDILEVVLIPYKILMSLQLNVKFYTRHLP